MEKIITQEELQQIKNLQSQIQQITLQIGTVEIKKIQLKEQIIQLQQLEEKIAKDLSSKYGVGSLDMDTGKITIADNK
jgi:small-conductance mechanosensitive channel